MPNLIVLIISMSLLFIGLGIGLYFALKSLFSQQRLEGVVDRVFRLTANQMSEQSRQALSGQTAVIQTDLVNKERAIKRMVDQLHEEIAERTKELRQFEKERLQSFSALNETLQQHHEITKDLKASTDTLHNVLSNNQMRGEWGEHIMEDLLKSSGFVEGIHYVKQTKLGEGVDRPDITLLLPNGRVVPVDVKFPYSALQKMSKSTNKAEKLEHQKQFAADIKTKIKKVALYIRPEDNTLDYAVMFVPNELIFSMINQDYPDVITQAINQRVLIVSPFTFLSVSRTIMESYRNFMMESNLRQIVKQITEFAKEWQMFIEEFDKLGSGITKLDEQYRKIRETRHRQLTKKIGQIEQNERLNPGSTDEAA